MNVLLTGGGGFIGSWLARGLRARGDVVADAETSLFDVRAMRDAISARPWDAVVHLAAVSSVPRAADDPDLAYRTNVACTALLLELVHARVPSAHVVFPSTAHVYAPAPPSAREVVIDEAAPIGPISVYGRTKWQGELIVADHAARTGQRATVLRLFNHTHRSQPPTAFLPHLYAALSAAGPAARIPVGNLHVRRDFGAVGDLVRAFVAAIDAPGEGHAVYNVCSGLGLQLEAIARGLAARLGVDATFVTDPSRVRSGEPDVVVGSCARVVAATGWRPGVRDLDSLLDAFLADDPLAGGS